MKYRTMNGDDYAAIISMSRASNGIRFTESEDINWHKSFLTRNPDMCFVAVNDDEIMGFVYCGSDGRRATVYHLAVSHACRRSGVASNLMKMVENIISRLGIARAQLMVFHDNKVAIEFYEKQGWRSRSDLVVMSKDMPKPNQAIQADAFGAADS